MENNFDFLVGEWTSVQRRLRKVLAGCDEWYEFEGETRSWSVLGGNGNVDEVVFPDQGFSGLTVRLLNPDTGQWSIFWVNSRNGELAMPPVVGRFDETGVGRFYSDEEYEGRQIKVRYQWEQGQDKARWAQAFSTDGGETWETNWTADFTRK